MIEITRLNGTQVFLNDDLIQTIEETPDTIITLTNGVKYVVQEDGEEIKNRIIEYKRRIFALDKIKKRNGWCV